MPVIKQIKNGIVVAPEPKPQFKILRDGNGNAIKVVLINKKDFEKRGLTKPPFCVILKVQKQRGTNQ